MSKHRISRRTFVKDAGAAALLVGTSACAGAGRRRVPATEKLNIACVGVGGQGAGDVRSVSSENIVALCDVDWKNAAGTFERFPKARKFKDYRRMLDKMDNQIDAVTVTTPDHTHFPAAMWAIRMGKHVFVQKPLTRTVWEARQLTLAAREHKVVTQMGNQGHANEGTRFLNEWVNAGVIGPVREVHIWTNRPIWPQGIDRPKERPPVPDTLEWDLWLGTAPERPYHPSYLPFNWRGWWDFGCGALGDMACHIMDASYWALGLGAPTSVEAVSSPVNDETAPNWSIITYRFPARGNKPPVKLVWFDGGKKPPRPKDLEEDRELSEGGQLILGDDGTIMDTNDYCNGPRLIPESRMRDFMPNRPAETIPRIPGGDHHQEWIRACKGGKPAGSNFDYSGPFTEMVVLGNLAVRTGQKIEWDAVNMKVTNVPEANRYVRSEYRKGWGV